jgi:acetylglutamate kinase
MAIVVQKYGGTSVANIDRIKNVARRVAKTYDQGNDVVVILSAMAGVTDGLIKLANQASDAPDKREMDVLLATGEQTTAALLAMMLIQMGYLSQSLLGHQAEVVTDCVYGNARIIEIGASRLRQLLDRKNIVVVAGFQGYDIKGNITTLGRGGSDTSAVAIAAALKADVCEITRMWTASTQPIPISAPKRANSKQSLTMKCSIWPVWAQKFSRSDRWDLQKNTVSPFMCVHHLARRKVPWSSVKIREWNNWWSPGSPMIRIKPASRSPRFRTSRELRLRYSHPSPKRTSSWI